jgi:hypothetical protein
MDDIHFSYNTKIGGGGREMIGSLSKKTLKCPQNSPPYPLTFFSFLKFRFITWQQKTILVGILRSIFLGKKS